MNTLKDVIKQTSFFIIVQVLVLAVLTYFVLTYEKSELQLIANTYYSTFFDFVFYILTHSVEFWGCLIIYVLIAFYKSYKYAIIGLLTYASAGLVTQILKRNVFPEFKRPTVNIENLRLIPEYFNYEQASNFSFPSGHTTVAFALFIFLTLIVKNKKWGIVFGIMACAVAYSRVYLSQHYFIDILAGSLIGTVVTLFSFYGFNKIKFGQWGNKRILK